jgi:hypothetical protein
VSVDPVSEYSVGQSSKAESYKSPERETADRSLRKSAIISRPWGDLAMAASMDLPRPNEVGQPPVSYSLDRKTVHRHSRRHRPFCFWLAT